jgi:hypothetical protein
LELCELQAIHRLDATLGPYGSYRDSPPRTGAGEDYQGIPGAPACEMTDAESGPVYPVTGKALGPLHQEGSRRDQTAKPDTEV